jgi:manganese/zinc/iron transport system permease protein
MVAMFEWQELLEVLSLRDYNTRLVVSSAVLLGAACGPMGAYLVLRRRSLMGDALSHATLPGVALAFLASVWLGGDGKSLPLLLCGAALTGLLGCGVVQFIRDRTRIKDDAAMGIVLSVFFGLGVVLLGFIQSMPKGSAAGLESFIYGKTASMVQNDFFVLSGSALVVLSAPVLLFKELRLLCFDGEYAAVLGWPVKRLDALLMLLLTVIVVAGLQAVGLVLIIAFLVIPGASARFWTERLDQMLLLSALFGAFSGWLGAALSALAPRLPPGALIVLVASVGFALSFFFGRERGLFIQFLRRRFLMQQGDAKDDLVCHR